MREYQFRGVLSRMVGEDAANSYVAYAGRVERVLQADLVPFHRDYDSLMG